MRFEWPHKISDELQAAFDRFADLYAGEETDETRLHRRSRAARKGWRTRKAMAKARERP